MWGRLIFIAEQLCKFGNTPTCVGKTGIEKVAELGNEKHPHMRGEDPFCEECEKTTPETPPHAWGRPERKVLPHSPREKHPHMRGEDPVDLLRILAVKKAV